MNRLKVLVAVLTVFLSLQMKAQIFINTGNPDLKEYMQQDTNAVIWDGSKNIPMPKNMPQDAPSETKVSSTTPATNNAATVVKHDVPVKKQATAKTDNQDLNSINHPSPAHNDTKATQAKSTPAAKTTTTTKTTTAKAVTTGEKPNSGNAALKSSTDQSGYVAHNNSTPISDYPADAIVGKCYARCMAPDVYEMREDVVVDKPASTKTEIIPATYETVMETVTLVPEGKRIIKIPAQYETVVENKMVAPATQKWVKTGTNKNCLSSNPADCEIWSLKQVDAVYQKVSRKVEVVPESIQEEVIPAQTQVIPRQKLVQPEREVKTEIPITYKTVMKKTMIKKGGYIIWKEILCDQDVTESKINQIQQALVREGYDVPVDNQMGDKTKQSLIKFQRDKGLPVGNLNMETLQALGVN